MADQVKVAVTGVSGRMGRMLVAAIAQDSRFALSGALERAGHDWIGRDLGQALGSRDLGVTVSYDLDMTLAASDVVIDFTAPAATLALAKASARHQTALVIGTTGFSAEELAELDQAAQTTPILRAGNMSLGVNLLTVLTRKVAAALGPEFDIEVIEAHHRHKVDAPSGTALMLGRAAAEGRGIPHDSEAVFTREGITGPRKEGTIGYATIRGGDIVGEHEVLFAGAGERITLRHVASDRMLFAKGALTAARWMKGKPAALYDMTDVLGLKD